jgi:hypothetical protein
MKKLLSLFFISFVFLSSVVFSVQAYDFSKNSGINEIATPSGYSTDSAQTPEYYIGLILKVLFSMGGLVFMILTIYAGIKWMTAQGNTSQVDTAKTTITRAIAGLAICLLSYALTFFVFNVFQGGVQKKYTPRNNN